MKLKKFVCFFLAFLTAAIWPVSVLAETEPKISAKTAVVINSDDGTVLYQKNEHEHLAIASTTKIMTALLTLEAAAQNNKTVTITADMVRVEGSSMGLRAGDRLTLRDLAAGMLSVSGNDAANSAAIAVSGSLQKFAELMNAKAAALGMKDTHFVTPSGLDDSNHYSSAYDMALLASAAMQNPDFAKIASQKTIKIHFTYPDTVHSFSNHNKLLSIYGGCTGVKTGFTKKAGRCLVSSAERDGVRVIVVTLNDPDDWKDHENLLNYGFSSLSCCRIDDSAYRVTVPVVGGTVQKITVNGTAGDNIVLKKDEAQTLKRTVELPRFVYAPVQAGQVLGCVRYICAGKTVAQTDLLAAENAAQPPVEKNWLQNVWDRIRNLFSFH